ncbi:hypothetical protein [Desulfitobacterium sp. LBE]|uniref:hypothetical protein n=1 Tax=Desulfitobacterium sp. LBE TaxID=884086 RepID=UPI00119D1981|nr:hypothetical protein [Desulfitobacterium sp. LBE]
MDDFTRADMEEALRAIASMINRTEKAQEKFAQGTWQHTMLSNNLKALHIALPMLTKALREVSL